MSVKRNLIYDVGLHTGEDTAYYLQKGFEVIAFEANPDMISLCQTKFSAEIEAGRLTIIEGAIVDSDKTKDESIKFYKNENLTVWSTVVQEFSKKYEELGTTSTIIDVKTVDFGACLKEYGIPYYLKIDIEGMDVVCLKALLPFEAKPAYISIEAEKVDFKELTKEFGLFERLGYHSFQIINQAEVSTLQEPKNSKEGKSLNYTFEMGSSGPFGSDLTTPWSDKYKAIKKYKRIFRMYRLWGDNSTLKNYFLIEFLRKLVSLVTGKPMSTIPGWYDTHARHSSFDPSPVDKTCIHEAPEILNIEKRVFE